MERLPRRFRVSRDVQMEAIASLIQPIPDLKNNAPATVIRIKARPLGCRSFHNQSIVVANAANERTAWPKLPICLLSGLQPVFIGLQVRKRVVDTNHRVKARFRDCAQLHHVRDRERNAKLPVRGFSADSLDRSDAYVTTCDIETFHREPQRLSSYAAGAIQHSNGSPVAALAVENAREHRRLSRNAGFPVLEYLVIVSGKLVVGLGKIGHTAF